MKNKKHRFLGAFCVFSKKKDISDKTAVFS